MNAATVPVVAMLEEQVPTCVVHPRDKAVGNFKLATGRTDNLCSLCAHIQQGITQLSRYAPMSRQDLD